MMSLGMKILDPVLVPDVSIWCDHINPKEFEDAGCVSVVVGLYASLDNKGGKILSPVSRQQCNDVATKSSMVLQAYFWDDITKDPIEQADWLTQIIKTEGLPIKWIWADQEQWWTDWTAWQQARAGRIPMSQIPSGSPAVISSHFESFILHLHSQFAQSGVYTNNGFVTTWAAGMDKWLSQYRAWVPHYGRQPAGVTQMTWEQLKATWLPNYDIILSAGQKPELVMGHQFTGDHCVLPGSYSSNNVMLPLDVNVFAKAFIEEIGGIILNPTPAPAPAPAPAQPPVSPPGTRDYVVLFPRINVRALPDGNSTWVRYAVKDELLHVVKIENDWAALLDGTYIYAGYIGPVRLDNPTPEPSPTPTPTPPTIPVPSPASVDYVVLYGRINVRRQPDSNSTWVRFADKNEVLHVVQVDNGWAQLSDGTYVYAGYIGPVTPENQPPPSPPVPELAFVDYVVIYERINVRSQPDSNSTWVRFAIKDEVLHVVKIENGWAQLSDGVFVFAEYIKKV